MSQHWGQPGALKTPLDRPPTASKPAAETRTPGSQETSALALAQTLSCLLQLFFLVTNTSHTPGCLASQQHLQVMLTAGEIGKTKAAPGDEKAHCSMPTIPSYFVLLRSKLFLQNYIVCTTKIILLLADLSGSTP